MGDGGNRTITLVDDVVSSREPRPGAMLVFTAGRPSDRALFFDGKPLRFGRTSEIAIDDPGMSGDHATIESLGGGRFRVTDRASKNGTFVNGACVRAGPVVVDGPFVLVRLGMTVLHVASDLGAYELTFIRTEGNEVIGASTHDNYRELGKAARDGANTLVLGETGTGKGRAAEAFHAQSGRRGKLLAMNCANIVDTLTEAQLFGARKGVGTGVEAQVGLFRAAHGGTVFLDEIGELPLALQAKLLGVVQDKVVTPLGTTTAEKVDVLLICATHRDLEQMVEEGRFREDLYRRLTQKVVRLLPLRERREEIPHLLALMVAGTGLRPNAQVIEALMLHHWPGNIRTFENVVRNAKGKAGGESVLTIAHLPEELHRGTTAPPPPPEPPADDEAPSKQQLREDVQRYYKQTRNARKAADLAGVKRSTAHRWLKEDGLLGDDEE